MNRKWLLQLVAIVAVVELIEHTLLAGLGIHLGAFGAIGYVLIHIPCCGIPLFFWHRHRKKHCRHCEASEAAHLAKREGMTTPRSRIRPS